GEEYQPVSHHGPDRQPPYCHFKTGALTPGDRATGSPMLNHSARGANAKSLIPSWMTILRRLRRRCSWIEATQLPNEDALRLSVARRNENQVKGGIGPRRFRDRKITAIP